MPASTTYEPIATTTLGSATGTVSFTSISQSYTDLVLVCNGQNATQNGWQANITFNSDTGSNYSITSLNGNGSVAASARLNNSTAISTAYYSAWTTTANSPGIYFINIMNYSNATTYKTTLIRTGYGSGTYAGAELIAGLWRNTAAITSVTLVGANSATWVTGTTFTLYGIKAA
jgi:hypothetical protein